MASDRERLRFPEPAYRSVVYQQGRVTLAADSNLAQEIASETLRQETLDIVGPAGTPDSGFEITFPPVFSVGPNPPPPSNRDFQVGPGTMYVGGLCIKQWPLSPERLPVTGLQQLPFPPTLMTYFTQPNWLDVPVPAVSPLEYIYLELEEREVSATEDPNLLDVALGGPDTTARTTILQRVRRTPTTATNCPDALAQRVDQWRAQGSDLDLTSMSLDSAARLRVGFETIVPPPTPCEPQVSNTYLGHDNQLIRVRLTANSKFLWGFNNASDLYRVMVAPTGDRLFLQAPPVDSFHFPRPNQTVELLRSEARLANGEYVAQAEGTIITLTAGYDPDTQSIPLPITIALPNASDPPLFLRIWEEVKPYTSNQPVKLGSTGLNVTISAPAGIHTGDFWAFAARAATPIIYPARYLQAPQPPDGPRIWECPLAIIQWTNDIGSVIADCRKYFVPMTALPTGPRIRITAVRSARIGKPLAQPLVNDTEIPVQRLIDGIDILCDTAPDPATLSRATCFLELYRPLGQPGNNPLGSAASYEAAVLASQITVAGSVISWRPSAEAVDLLQRLLKQPSGDRGYLACLTLRGNFIWSSARPDRFLDGDTFGIRLPNTPNTSLRLPSGDRLNGGDFFMWLWLQSERLPLLLSVNAVPTGISVRAEGFTELLGDIVISGGGGVPTPAFALDNTTGVNIKIAVPSVDIRVSIWDAHLTSRLVNSFPLPLCDAVLLIDDPASAKLNKANSVFSTPVYGVGGNGLDYANGAAPNVFLGRRVDASTVLFRGIPLDAPGPNGVRTLRIKNLRAAIVGNLPDKSQVWASVSIEGLPEDYILQNNTVLAGNVQLSPTQVLSLDLRKNWVETTTFSFKQSDGVNTIGIPVPPAGVAQLERNITLRYTEGFPAAFKFQGAGNVLASGPIGLQEEGYDPGIPGLQVSVAKDSNTRFVAQFTNIPAGIRLFVTTSELLPPTGGAKAKLMLTSDPNGDGLFAEAPSVGATIEGTPVAELAMSAGTANAVWEWKGTLPDAGAGQLIDFGVALVAARIQAQPGIAKVTLSLGPISTIGAAQQIGTPIPKFGRSPLVRDFFRCEAGVIL